MARSEGPRTAVTKALSTLRQVRDERRARRTGHTPGTDPLSPPGPKRESGQDSGSHTDIADTTPDNVPTGEDAGNRSTSREGHEPTVDDPTQNDTAENQADGNKADGAAATGTDATDAPRPAKAPKPKGGRGIDGATQVISRDNLPSPEDLEDLDTIDPLGADDAGTSGEETPAAPTSKPARLGPSDSKTTVIRREDLPDPSELEDLDDIDATAAPETETEAVENPASASTAEAEAEATTADDDESAVPGAEVSGAEESGTEKSAESGASETREAEDADDAGESGATVAAVAAGSAAAGAAVASTGESDEDTSVEDETGEPEAVDAAADGEAETSTAAIEEEDTKSDEAATEPAGDAAAETAEPTETAEATETEVQDEAASDEPVEVEATGTEGTGAEDTETDDTETDEEAPSGEAPTEAIVLPPTAEDTDELSAASEDVPEDESDSDAATKVIPAAAAGAAAAGATAAGTKSPATDERTDTVPEPAVAPSSTGEWTTTTHQPQVIPGSKPSKTTKKRGKGPLIAVVALLVVIVAAIGGIFAYQNMTATPPADEAAEVALDYTTALYEGDLETLRSVTCGELHAFYTDFDDAAYQKTYDAQKARNELVQTQAINAVRVVEGGDLAVVEVVAVHTSSPETPETVTLNLQRDGDAWKVCNPT
ncbi:hypothetical protein IHQ52_23350 [Gordonia amicalis]|uniref:Rv0361 family membrane protein n=1 Tax=Gordonia amicalis TaxID=89053 RepID=UPI001EE0FEF4|nr:hypothetical protein [Gordonia amicalis]UKO91832.1 hypothetical protein IHQ52_23350 [Gordonia amicalis]